MAIREPLQTNASAHEVDAGVVWARGLGPGPRVDLLEDAGDSIVTRRSWCGQSQPMKSLLHRKGWPGAASLGTSTGQIDRTYGHLLPDAVDYERDLPDAFDARQEPEAAEN
jgi:hypothetical protein